MVDPGNYSGRRYYSEKEANEAQWQAFCEAKGIDPKAFDDAENLTAYIEEQCIGPEYAETAEWLAFKRLIESDADCYKGE